MHHLTLRNTHANPFELEGLFDVSDERPLRNDSPC